MTARRQAPGQFPLPLRKPPGGERYDIYPSFNAGEGHIHAGFTSLFPLILRHRTVIVDGYNGIFMDLLSQQIIDALSVTGTRVRCIFTGGFLKPETEIMELTFQYAGSDDPLLGTRYTLPLPDFYRMQELKALSADPAMDNISRLNPDVPNYAWSSELITPQNGLLLESSSLLLEVSFDSLMYTAAESVPGDCHWRFGTDFPIRFDYPDTFNGGNLSIQCHQRPEYTKKHFGENFTQEECYYILDSKDEAVVNLGFREDINPDEFISTLKVSAATNQPLDTDRYIRKLPAARPDIFLIPCGTVHGSGKNNMVLGISSTPYIFTFKMYDWLRIDLNGNPHDLNIERARDNLFFDRKGEEVSSKIKAQPVILHEGSDWQLWHLPTHETHLYDVQRSNFRTSVEIATGNKCLVMNLVEGKRIAVETRHGLRQKISYAETFVIPAAAETAGITNISGSEATLVLAFVK
ncbi:MAG: class I mannose-6-phosphate isomerase [Bacteroidales bacterium]